MAERMVKVTIAAGYEGHRHRGIEKHPGDSFETEESRAKWLREIGAIEPYENTRRRRAASKDEESEESEQSEESEESKDAAEPDEDESDGDTTTEG